MKDFENADKTFHLALHKEPDNIGKNLLPDIRENYPIMMN